jgi:hypothetical protein
MLAAVMQEGWDGLALGQALEDRTASIAQTLPLGITLDKVTDQAVNITSAVDEFMMKFAMALGVVLLVSLLSLGWRVGIVVAAAVPLTHAVVFLIMLETGRFFDRITLGALILALGLLVDDSIIAIEVMVVKMEEGMDRLKAAYAWSHTAAPTLSGTLVAIAGFLPVGFRRMPFASSTLGAERPLLASELLGLGRDPLAPVQDAVTADGDVVVPIDAETWGAWLKAACGEPTTTGTGPYTHEYRSGGWTLPSMSIETGMPEVPSYGLCSGMVLDQLSWRMQRGGLLTATARLVAQGETVAAASAVGAPVDWTLARFGQFNGSVPRNGAALGNIVSAEVT